jgi:hypothetical protein
MNPELVNHPGWKSCTFEGAELNSLLLGLETSFREKIIWMEEMQKIQERIAENRIKRLAAKTELKIP